jgi:hypothetical protein
MKKFTLTSLLALLSFSFAGNNASAQTEPYHLGPCYGEIAKENRIAYDMENVDISAAVYIPASYAATVAGGDLTTLRVAMNSKIKVSNLTVWIREDLNGANITETFVESKSLSKGWNKVTLKNPYKVSDKGFYMGYTYRQTGEAKFIFSLDRPGEKSLMVKGGDFDWEDASHIGTLCLEGFVEGCAHPARNGALVSAETPEYFIITDNSLSGKVTVRNLGTETINGFDLEMTVEGTETEKIHIDSSIGQGSKSELDFTFPLNLDTTDPYERKITFTLSSISGNSDPDMSNNTVYKNIKLKKNSFPRNVFIEEFTTEQCANCPRVAAALNEVLESGKYPGAEAVCHHSGFETDWLTIPSDIQYLWFYGGPRSFAPGMTMDRTAFPGEVIPVKLPLGNDITDWLDYRLSIPSFAEVKIELSEPDENSNIVSVGVYCERADKRTLAGDTRLTLFLVEDNIKARFQAGSIHDFTHHHVNRAVNTAWGAPVKWDGLHARYTYDFQLDPSWKREDMKVVAVLSAFDSSDPTRCAVENCVSMELNKGGGLVKTETVAAEAVPEAYFDLCGTPLEKPAKGINIVKMSDGTVKKILIQ